MHFEMGSSVGHALYYCCIWNGRKKVYLHNNGGRELEKLADLCLENIPAFHRWYFRTVKGRTYGFMMEEGTTYFAIADSNIRNPSILLFLQHVRDGYKFSRNGFQEELVPVVQQLIASLESLPRLNGNNQITEVPVAHEGMASEMPLLGRSFSKKEGKKMASMAIEAVGDDESHFNRGISLNASPQIIGGFSLQRSSSSNGSMNQLIGRRLWFRQVKILVAIDVLVCMILFGVWLAICEGFTCVK